MTHPWNSDLHRMLPGHLDFRSSPGDPNVEPGWRPAYVRQCLVWDKVVLMALAMYTLSGFGELGLMTDFGLG